MIFPHLFPSLTNPRNVLSISRSFSQLFHSSKISSKRFPCCPYILVLTVHKCNADGAWLLYRKLNLTPCNHVHPNPVSTHTWPDVKLANISFYSVSPAFLWGSWVLLSLWCMIQIIRLEYRGLKDLEILVMPLVVLYILRFTNISLLIVDNQYFTLLLEFK